MASDFSTPTAPALVIGVGTEYRGDDRIGLIVARIVDDLNLPNVTVTEQSGEGVALMHAWEKAERVLIIDAVSAGAAPGTIFRLDPNAEPIPSKFFHASTHEFGVAEAVELARALHELPLSLKVYGVQGKQFGFGEELSEEVQKAINGVISMIVNDLASEFSSSSNGL